MSAKHLILGLDGVDLDLVEQMGPEALPTLHALMTEGSYAHLVSVEPPATLPNWTTFLTGLDPGAHGVFDFTTRKGYRVAFTAGSVREAPTIFARLDRLGLRTACVGFPATWPPEQLEHGVFISGWDAPVAFEADASFVWPRALYAPLKQRFAAHKLSDVDEFRADEPGFHESLPGRLALRIDRKVAMARWLLGRESWDAFALYFGESDTASHHLFSLHDPASPRHPHNLGYAGDGLSQVYRRLDAAVDELRRAAGEDVELTLVSDHGSGGSSDVVLYLNRALAEAGLLRFVRRSPWPALVGGLKDAALSRLSPRLRERLFALGDRALPGWLESRARFGDLDMSRSRAFSQELNYFPSVSYNLRGREPSGVVAPSERDALRREIEGALFALRDPWNGQQVVEAVHAREELYEGAFVERAPDLVITLALREGYSYNLAPSGTGPAGTGPFRRLAPEEYLGRKGRSMPGAHRPRGIYIAHGPSVLAAGRVEAGIADASATLLSRLGIAPPPEARGRVLFEILRESGEAARRLPDVVGSGRRRQAGEAAVAARLRALGYID